MTDKRDGLARQLFLFEAKGEESVVNHVWNWPGEHSVRTFYLDMADSALKWLEEQA